VSGGVAHPGTYDQNALAALSHTILVTTNPSPAPPTTYNGTQLFSFLSPTDANSLNQIVTAVGSDGYTVVYSLAELDPAYGGDPNIMLASSQTTGSFPGVARTILPLDNRHGRWESNLVSLDVRTVPGPEVGAGASSFALAALFLGWLVRRRGRQFARDRA
jgi:hypothetical protein